MWNPVDEYHVLCFPDADSTLSFQGALLGIVTGKRIERHLAGAHRAVLFRRPTPIGDAECAEYMYASAGALRLVRELGLQAPVAGKIPSGELPEDVVLLIGDEQDRPRGRGK